MDFGNKVKMVRNGIGLSSKDFADVCGISCNALNKIENLITTPHKDTIDRIERYINSMGWIFVDNGVLKDTRSIIFYNNAIEVLNNAFVSLSPNEELMLFKAEERRSSKEILVLMDKMRDKGIKIKQLVSERDPFHVATSHEYRTIPHTLFSNKNCIELIYGDKWVTKYVLKDKENNRNKKLYMAIKNKLLYNRQKNEFMYWWNLGKKL